MHSQEVRRIIERSDQLQFIYQRLPRALRNSFGIACFCTFPDESLKRLLGRCMTLAQLFRVAMPELVKAEGKAVEEADGLGDGLRRRDEQPRHLVRSFEMALGVGLREEARC